MSRLSKKILVFSILLPLCCMHEAAPASRDMRLFAIVSTAAGVALVTVVAATGIGSAIFCNYKAKLYNEQVELLQKNEAILTPDEIVLLQELMRDRESYETLTNKITWLKRFMYGSLAVSVICGLIGIVGLVGLALPQKFDRLKGVQEELENVNLRQEQNDAVERIIGALPEAHRRGVLGR